MQRTHSPTAATYYRGMHSEKQVLTRGMVVATAAARTPSSSSAKLHSRMRAGVGSRGREGEADRSAPNR